MEVEKREIIMDVQKSMFGLRKQEMVKDGSPKKNQFKKKGIVNSLSKQDYSFFYESSIWDQYEDFVYAIQRNRYEEVVRIFKLEAIAIDEVLRPVIFILTTL